MNIAFATDENYVGPLAVVLNSLLRYTDGTLCIYLIDGGISEPSWERLSEIVQGPGRTLVRLTVPKGLFEGAKVSGWLSASTYSRIALPELVPDLQRILYLDCDLLVRDNIRTLYDSNLGSNIVGCVEDFGFNEFDRLGILRADRYFNAGVMLIDIPAWNNMDMSNKVLHHIRHYPERATWHDQCHLNACLTRQWQQLNPRWNVQLQMLKGAAMRIRQNSPAIIAARKNPGIIHFTSDQKPWVRGSGHPYTHDFYRELAKTPCRTWKPATKRSQWWAPFKIKSLVRRGQFIFTSLCDKLTRVTNVCLF